MEFVTRYFRKCNRSRPGIDRGRGEPDHGSDGRRPQSTAGGCSSSASAAAPATPGTPSTTSGRSRDFESYAPTDNVSELTARINDDGWDTAFANWLKGSRLSADDMLLILSVGGGDPERNVSMNLVKAMEHAREVGAKIGGIVGRDGGYTAKVADACVIVPTIRSRDGDGPQRAVPGRRLAPLRLGPAPPGGADEVGEPRAMTALARRVHRSAGRQRLPRPGDERGADAGAAWRWWLTRRRRWT